jgi:hypothetical protein
MGQTSGGLDPVSIEELQEILPNMFCMQQEDQQRRPKAAQRTLSSNRAVS